VSSVTIIVNNYNYARYVGAAIDSALAQDAEGVEVVVVDDGSGDASRHIIAGYGDRVVAVMKDNGGQASAFNVGFAVATGEIVVFLDADDLLDASISTRLVKTFADDPALALVQYRLRMVDGDGASLGAIRPPHADVMPSGDLSQHVLRYRSYHWQPTSGNAYAASALRRILPVPESTYRVSADAYLAALIPLCGRIRSLDVVGGSYRVHGTSNFSAKTIDGAFFRSRLRHIDAGHEAVRRLAPALGVAPPALDPASLLDAAYLTFRLGSLVVDPSGHPYRGDTRMRLASRGIHAALVNPMYRWRNRARRVAWFAAAGFAPRAMARRAVLAHTPDTPARRARLLDGH